MVTKQEELQKEADAVLAVGLAACLSLAHLDVIQIQGQIPQKRY